MAAAFLALILHFELPGKSWGANSASAHSLIGFAPGSARLPTIGKPLVNCRNRCCLRIPTSFKVCANIGRSSRPCTLCRAPESGALHFPDSCLHSWARIGKASIRCRQEEGTCLSSFSEVKRTVSNASCGRRAFSSSGNLVPLASRARSPESCSPQTISRTRRDANPRRFSRSWKSVALR